MVGTIVKTYIRVFTTFIKLKQKQNCTALSLQKFQFTLDIQSIYFFIFENES